MKKQLLTTCLLLATLARAEAPKNDEPTVRDTGAENLFRYMWANYQQFGGNKKEAYERYKYLASNQAPVHTYKGYLHLLSDIQAFKEIIYVMPKVQDAFKDETDIQLIFAKALKHTGKDDEAADLLIRLNDTHKDNQEIAFETAQSYLARKEPHNALLVIDNLLNTSVRKPNNFIFHFLKAQIYLRMNEKQKALQSVKKSIDLYPSFDKGWLLYGMLHEQKGEIAQAVKGYSTFLELTDDKNQQLEMHLLGLLFRQKLVEQKQASIAFDRPCIEQALLLFNQKKYQKALQHIDSCLVNDPKNYEGRLLKVQILSTMNEYDKAAQLLQQWIVDENDTHDWLKALHAIAYKPAARDAVLKVLLELEKNHSNQLLVTLYITDIYTRDHNNSKALEYHKKALSLTADSMLKSKILYQIALIHYEQKQFKKMEEALEQGKRLQQDFLPALNLLAYHYTSNRKLDEAQELMNIVLKKDKKNPHFWDTQALIYYKRGEYDKAVKILQKIVKAVPFDFTAKRHLAKAQYKRGNVRTARNLIKQTIKLTNKPHEKQQCDKYLKCWTLKKS